MNDRYIKRRGKYTGNKSYSIENYTLLNKNFMTDKEIKKMYADLKNHMYIVYSNYDDEIVQQTILKGLNYSHLYDSNKSSKLVWFQTILRNIYLREKTTKFLSKHELKIKQSIKLDDDLQDGLSLHETLAITDDIEEDINIADEVLRLIQENDCFVYLKLRANEISYNQIRSEYNLTNGELSYRLIRERELLKSMINDKEIIETLNKRIKKRINRDLIEKKVYKKNFTLDSNGNKVRDCIVCGVIFIIEKGVTGNIKTCSLECREIRRKRESDKSNALASEMRRLQKNKCNKNDY